MMTIDEIRRANLERLIAEFGNATALAAVIEKSEAQISQWKKASPDSKTGKPRGMSDDVCREIERRCGKERGWMDNAHETHGERSSGAVPMEELVEVAEAASVYLRTDDTGRKGILSALRAARDGLLSIPTSNDKLERGQ